MQKTCSNKDQKERKPQPEVYVRIRRFGFKIKPTQYYKQNLFKQNLLINYKNTSLSQSSGVIFFIILLPPKMVFSHVNIYSKYHRIP